MQFEYVFLLCKTNWFYPCEGADHLHNGMDWTESPLGFSSPVSGLQLCRYGIVGFGKKLLILWILLKKLKGVGVDELSVCWFRS